MTYVVPREWRYPVLLRHPYVLNTDIFCARLLTPWEAEEMAAMMTTYRARINQYMEDFAKTTQEATAAGEALLDRLTVRITDGTGT